MNKSTGFRLIPKKCQPGLFMMTILINRNQRMRATWFVISSRAPWQNLWKSSLKSLIWTYLRFMDLKTQLLGKWNASWKASSGTKMWVTMKHSSKPATLVVPLLEDFTFSAVKLTPLKAKEKRWGSEKASEWNSRLTWTTAGPVMYLSVARRASKWALWPIPRRSWERLWRLSGRLTS